MYEWREAYIAPAKISLVVTSSISVAIWIISTTWSPENPEKSRIIFGFNFPRFENPNFPNFQTVNLILISTCTYQKCIDCSKFKIPNIFQRSQRGHIFPYTSVFEFRSIRPSLSDFTNSFHVRIRCILYFVTLTHGSQNITCSRECIREIVSVVIRFCFSLGARARGGEESYLALRD